MLANGLVPHSCSVTLLKSFPTIKFRILMQW